MRKSSDSGIYDSGVTRGSVSVDIALLIKDIVQIKLCDLTSTIILGWQGILVKNPDIETPDKQTIYKLLSNLFLRCFQPEHEAMKSILKFLDPSQEILKKLDDNPNTMLIQLLFSDATLEEKILSLSDTKQNFGPFGHYFLLLSQYQKEKERARFRDPNLSKPFLDIINAFSRRCGDDLMTIAKEDVRVATQIAEIYFNQYTRCLHHPQRDSFLDEAYTWSAGFGAAQEEPVACSIYGKILNIKAKTDPKYAGRSAKYIALAKKHSPG